MPKHRLILVSLAAVASRSLYRVASSRRCPATVMATATSRDTGTWHRPAVVVTPAPYPRYRHRHWHRRRW